MSKIPFEQSEKALAILAEGKALAVEFIFDDTNLALADYKDSYYDQLGYKNDPRMKDIPLTATILSEIGNMPGHYVVAAGAGKIICGLHGDFFYVDEDDL